MILFTRATGLVALALLVACQLDGRLVSASGSVRILDESDPLDIEAIARIMCESKSKRDGQISRLSTVDKLVEFFDQQVSGESHALFKCKQQHGETIRQLQKALNASKENVCSDEKLALVEDFHNQFVSRLVEHKKSRKEERREAAPQLLRLFFMHYAMEVNVVCRRNLVKNVELGLKQRLGDDVNERLFDMEDQGSDSHGNAASGVLFQKAMQRFTDLNPVGKCEDVLLMWDLIENSNPGKKSTEDDVTLQDEIDAQTGEPIRLLVKLRSPGSFNAIKEHCHYNLKPVYSKLVLPIIKLADLGYSNNGEQYSELKPSEQLKRWYSATQLCEAILPIKFYKDLSLDPKDFVVITKRDATEFEVASAQTDVKSKVQLVYEPDTNSMEDLDRLESVAKVDPKKLVKSVKSNVKARRHVIGRIVISLARKYKSSFKGSRVGRIFFPKRADQSGLAKEEVASKELSETLENMSDEDIEKLDEEAPSRMLRTRGKTTGLPKMRLSSLLTLRKNSNDGKGLTKFILIGTFIVALAGFAILFAMG